MAGTSAAPTAAGAGWLQFPRRLLHQTRLLVVKNYYVHTRSKVATFSQTFVGLLFLVLLVMMEASVTQQASMNEVYTDSRDPTESQGSELVWCTCGDESGLRDADSGVLLDNVCFTFVYAPSNDSLVQAAVAEMVALQGLPGEGEPYGVLGLEDGDAVDAWLLQNYNTTRMAVVFDLSAYEAEGSVQYALQVNQTFICSTIGSLDCDDWVADYRTPLQRSVDTALLRLSTGQPGASISVSFSNFPHPDLEARWDVMRDYGPVFLYIIVVFNLVVQLVNIVAEKELLLRDTMQQMGLLQSAYWLSWGLTDAAINVIAACILIVFGHVLGMDLFLENDFGTYFVFLIVAMSAFTGLALLFSTVVRTTEGARSLGVAFYIVTFIAVPVLMQVYYANDDPNDEGIRNGLAFLPGVPFFKGATDLIEESSGETKTGLAWADRDRNNNYFSLQRVYEALLLDALICGLGTWYLDNVLPSEFGLRRQPWFFLLPSYWLGSSGSSSSSSGVAPSSSGNLLGEVTVSPDLDQDVRAEAEAVRDGTCGDEAAVVVRGLTKTFVSRSVHCCCPCCGGGGGACCRRSDFTAVDNVSFSIKRDSLFVFLGHNGAGKSTIVSLLTGLRRPTAGDATIFGHSILTDFDAIRKVMGVCLQHDVLWDNLTAREHLQLFARLKNMPSAEIAAEVDARLADVLLTAEADQTAGSYSGGMRRRLSIAMALLGDPKIVFLDEPTTGMDPVTRQSVWEMIARAKSGRVILLTTHSMEEADTLGDRIAVMNKGQLQALGTSVHLKNRFGAGYRLTLASAVDNEAATTRIKDFVMRLVPGAKRQSAFQGCQIFALPRSLPAAALPPFLRELEARKAELGVVNISITLTTLEEVFLNLSERAMSTVFHPSSVAQRSERSLREDSNSSKPPTTVDDLRRATLSTRAPPPTDEQQQQQHKVRSFTAVGQFRALFAKNWAYQRTQTLQMAAITLMPMVLLLGFYILQQAVFVPLTEDAINDVDHECMAELFATTYVLDPELALGEPSFVNEVCDQGECYAFQEQPLWTSVPVAGAGAADMGALEHERSDAVEAWYEALMDLSKDALQCELDFDEALEDDGDLADAQEWLEAQAGLQSGVGACQKSGSELADGTFQPSAGTLADLAAERAAADACADAAMSAVLAHFSVSENAFLAELDALAANATAGSSGPLGALEGSAVIKDELFGAVEDHFLGLAWPPMLQCALSYANSSYAAACEADEHCGWSSSLGYCETALPPSTSALRLTTLCEYAPAQVLLGTDGDAELAETVCAVARNLDFVRGLATETYPSSAALRAALYGRWFGELQGQFRLATATAYDVSVADTDAHQYEYRAYVNYTATGPELFWRPWGYGDNVATAVHLLDRAILREAGGLEVRMQLKTFPVLFREELLDPFGGLSVIDFIASGLLPYFFLLHSFVIMSLIVYEKSQHLRDIMKMMGLQMHVYWTVNYLFYLAQFGALVAVTWIVGLAIDMQFFSLHDFGPLFLFLFVWGNLLVMYSFLLSVFFSRPASSTSVSFLLMLVYVEAGSQLLVQMLLDESSTEASYSKLMWLPPIPMLRASLWFSYAAAFNMRIGFDTWHEVGYGAVPRCVAWMACEWVVCAVLLWYFEQTVTAGSGVRQHPLFFLSRAYWRRGGGDGAKKGGAVAPVEYQEREDLPEDVAAERYRVFHPTDDWTPFVRVLDLHKRFPGRGKAPPKVAVKSLSLGVNRECLGILGHNGAGKSTTISILAGLFEPTSGQAFVGPYSIARDIVAIHQLMGVCPQHDVLWATLSAREHLLFFGRLRGLTGAALDEAVDDALAAVSLTPFQARPAGRFSGGMKRRLSVANALVGSPQLVYLDEPSTGLDPASRHELWNVIASSKRDKSIVLTTHSMEEADVLCDRLGIMAEGQLECIGSGAALKLRYGVGYTLSVSTADQAPAAAQAVVDFVLGRFSSARLLGDPLAGTCKFELLRGEVVLSSMFEDLTAAAPGLGVTDWGLFESTLEDVFLNIVKGQK